MQGLRVPTVLRFAGYRVTICANDHRPAHVHVIGHGTEAVFELNRPDGPSRLRQSFGCSRRDVAGIEDALAEAVAALCAEWEVLHGPA